MNYKALNRQELEGLARARFGEILRYRKLKDEEIIEELEAYDRFVKGKKNPETAGILPSPGDAGTDEGGGGERSGKKRGNAH